MQEVDILEWEKQGLIGISYSVSFDRQVKPYYYPGASAPAGFESGRTSYRLTLQYTVSNLTGDIYGNLDMDLSEGEAKALLNLPPTSLEELMTTLCVQGCAHVWLRIEDTLVRACAPQYEMENV